MSDAAPIRSPRGMLSRLSTWAQHAVLSLRERHAPRVGKKTQKRQQRLALATGDAAKRWQTVINRLAHHDRVRKAKVKRKARAHRQRVQAQKARCRR